MKTRLIIAGLVSAALFTGCFKDEENALQSPVLEIEDITVPADTVAGTVTYRLPVICNESWSVVENTEAETWVEFEIRENLNTTGVKTESFIEFRCEDNDENEPREAVFKIVTPSNSGSIRLTQRGKVNRVAVDGPLSYELAASDVNEISVNVKSNTLWEAEVDESSTAKVKLSSAGAYGDGTFTITPTANFAADTVKTAIINILAEDTETVCIRITQNVNDPTVEAKASSLTITALPTDTSGELVFSANMPWKIEVLSSTLEELSFDSMEGEYSNPATIGFKFAENESQTARSAQIKVSLKDHPEKSVTYNVTQFAGISLYLDLLHVKDAEACPLKPYSEEYPPIGLGSDNIINNWNDVAYKYKFTDETNEYVFELKFQGYYIYPSPTISYFWSNKGYIKFPAIEGYRLAFVGLTTAATSKIYGITSDEAGEVIVGEKQTLGKGVYGTWLLTGTEYNTSYYEYIYTSSSRQTNLVLVYVK